MSKVERNIHSQTTSCRLAHSICDVTKITGVGRSLLYEEIKEGRLRIRKQSINQTENIANNGTGNTAANLIGGYASAPAQSVSANSIASNMSPYMNQYVMQSLAPQLQQMQTANAATNQATDAQATGSGAYAEAIQFKAGAISVNDESYEAKYVSRNTPYQVSCSPALGGSVEFGYGDDAVTVPIYGWLNERKAENPPPLGVIKSSVAAANLSRTLCERISLLLSKIVMP